MQRVKTASAVQDRPAYSDAGTPGYFRNGDAVAAIPATVPGQDWFNLVQEELLNVIKAAGLTPSALDDTQLRQAVIKLIAEALESISVPAASETDAGIIRKATAAEALAGVSDEPVMSPADVAAAIAGVARAYSKVQSYEPVIRNNASGAQAINVEDQPLLVLNPSGPLTFPTPTRMAHGRPFSVIFGPAASVSLAWDAAAFKTSTGYSLPAATPAGKYLILNFFCLSAAACILTGITEEA